MSHQSLLKRPDGTWLRSFRWFDSGKRDFFPMPPVSALPALPAYFVSEGDAQIVVDYLQQASGVRARVVEHAPPLQLGNDGIIEESDCNRFYAVVSAELEDTGDQPSYPFPRLPALFPERVEAEVLAEVMARTQGYESHIVERRLTRLIRGEPTLVEPSLFELRAGPEPVSGLNRHSD